MDYFETDKAVDAKKSGLKGFHVTERQLS
jgi:hypothetical protein